MNGLTQVKKDVIEHLKKTTAFSKINIYEEYDGGTYKNPINSPHLFIGIDSVELSPSGLGGYIGQLEPDTFSGNTGRITLSVNIYASSNDKSGSLHFLFEELCFAIMDCDLGVVKIYCESISPVKSEFSNKLTAKIELLAFIAKSEKFHPVNDFILKRSENSE